MLFALLIAVYFIALRIRKTHLPERPEYRFFLWGLWAKIFGGILFGCIYIFHYGQGDTTSFYECSLSFCKLFHQDFPDFISAYLGPGTEEVKSYFTAETGEPMMYMLAEGSSRFVIKLLVPFMLVTGGSYFLTTVLISIFTYGGLWKLYLMFTSYFPAYSKNLAIAILFMPSVIFWGSGILKDSFTLAATCYLIVATNNIITRKGKIHGNILRVIFFAYIVISIKAYVILILLPSSLVWFCYSRIKRIRNRLVRYLVVPFTYILIIIGSYVGLRAFGERLGKFSIDRALKTAAITQKDLKQEYYEGNSFDIGDFEPTPSGALSKFPQATIAGLYRPFLWDSNNAIMIISGIENFLILALTIFVLVKIRWKTLRRLISENPVILYSFVFSVLFAFMIGLTTSNYGALVRFRIPLIPLYMACIMIMYSQATSHVKTRKEMRVRENS